MYRTAVFPEDLKAYGRGGALGELLEQANPLMSSLLRELGGVSDERDMGQGNKGA